MKATVSWLEGERFEAVPASGKALVFDGNGESGLSPMEAVISALGACSSIDVVMILEKGRHAIDGCRCELSGQRADSPPRVFTAIHAHFVVSGENLSDKAVGRAVSLSFDKYCSVAKMLDGAVDLSHSHAIA